MSYRALIAPAVFVLAAAALIALILSGLTASQAVQNPTMAIDMVTTGNSYDDTTNTASNLVPGDTNGAADGFVRDRQASTTERVTVANDQSQGNGGRFPLSLSSDGRLVGFSVLASNLLARDTNCGYGAVVRDRQASVTEPGSVASHGTQGIGEGAGDALVSRDARFVAFP